MYALANQTGSFLEAILSPEELKRLSPDELAHLYFGTADESRATNGQAATTKATTEVP